VLEEFLEVGWTAVEILGCLFVFSVQERVANPNEITSEEEQRMLLVWKSEQQIEIDRVCEVFG
jgi:hypothetical protein